MKSQRCSTNFPAQTNEVSLNEFEGLLVSHQGLITAVLARTLPPGYHHKIDDLAQITAIKAIKSFHTFVGRGPEAFRPWLTVIARNTAYDLLRQLKNEPGPLPTSTDGEPIPVPDDQPTPGSLVAKDEQAQLVRAAVQKLRADYREVIERRLNNMNLQEIADELGISVSTAWSRERLGRRWLRQNQLLNEARQDWTDLPQSQ